MLIQTKE